MSDDEEHPKDSKKTGPRPALELIPGSLKAPRPLRDRLLAVDPFLIDPSADGPILYQHSVLCQTCLPYRDPGETRVWQRKNGLVRLEVEAGRAYDGEDFVDVGLPYGPKPRLVLYHLNAEALRTQSPYIELEDSLTAFVKRTLGLDVHGRNIRTVKDQLVRLSASDFRIGTVATDGRAITLKGTVIDGFELWVTKDPKQRMLWPSTIEFSERYFQSLMKHAVPLNETAVARLSHSAMALDIYTWLAQRLHRVEEGKGILIPWTALHEQFGQGYAQIRQFRAVYIRTLKMVRCYYPDAKFNVGKGGMTLWHSRPPVARRFLPLSGS
ncbi:MAG: replication protein RepA [Steroidobacteraceae bacterium]